MVEINGLLYKLGCTGQFLVGGWRAGDNLGLLVTEAIECFDVQCRNLGSVERLTEHAG